MLTYEVKIRFTEPGYIAHPYWPAMNTLINAQKESGINRARSPANRRKALEEWLELNNMALSDYQKLEQDAARPFHTEADGEIIIPSDKVLSFLVAATDELRSANRPCPPDQVRSRIGATDWHTGKMEPDGAWERYVVVESGVGQKLSNQRGFRRSFFIKNFVCTGSLSIDTDFVKPEVLHRAIEWGGENIGIGAARKMGWGRFAVESFMTKSA